MPRIHAFLPGASSSPARRHVQVMRRLGDGHPSSFDQLERCKLERSTEYPARLAAADQVKTLSRCAPDGRQFNAGGLGVEFGYGRGVCEAG